MANILNNINYQILGEDASTQCIFLHGLLGRGKNWYSFAKYFSSKCQCLIYDQRGHGDSFQPEQGYELSDYSNDLRELLDALDWDQPAIVVGHSMGGRTALQFAHHHPERVKALVIVDIGATSDWASMSSILEKIDFVPQPFESRKDARAFFEGPFMEKYQSAMLKDFFYSNIKEQTDGRFGWVFSEKGVKSTLENSRLSDYWAMFRGLPMPTLLLRGERSTDLAQEDYEKILANNPKIQGQVIENSGHWVHAEQPKPTQKALEDFFNKL